LDRETSENSNQEVLVDEKEQQSRDLLVELKKLEEQKSNPVYKTYSKTIYWNNPKSGEENKKQEFLMQEITTRLDGIEEKLDRLALLLMVAKTIKNQSPED